LIDEEGNSLIAINMLFSPISFMQAGLFPMAYGG
jgi:hypothetical protein